MTKQEKIRNSYLLITFSLLVQVFEASEIDPRKMKLEECNLNDLIILDLYKWLDNIKRIYAKPGVQAFASKRLSKIFNREYSKVDKLVSALLIFYLYLDFSKFNDKKDWIVPPIDSTKLKELLSYFSDVSQDTVDFAYAVITALDPDKKRIVELKSTMGTLFNPRKENNECI